MPRRFVFRQRLDSSSRQMSFNSKYKADVQVLQGNLQLLITTALCYCYAFKAGLHVTAWSILQDVVQQQHPSRKHCRHMGPPQPLGAVAVTVLIRVVIITNRIHVQPVAWRSTDSICVFAGLLAGMDPLVEAVAQLPTESQPIPSTVKRKVKEFLREQFVQYMRAAAVRGGPPGNYPTLVQAEGVQTISGLHSHLLQFAGVIWELEPLEQTRAHAYAVGKLVTGAAQAVALEDGTDVWSSAYCVLLAQCYRAGTWSLVVVAGACRQASSCTQFSVWASGTCFMAIARACSWLTTALGPFSARHF